jgi:branched-chain amino acid transport system substrate-binding protein
VNGSGNLPFRDGLHKKEKEECIMRNYLKYAVVLTLLAALLALGGISCNGEETIQEGDTYKLGAALDLNGAYSNLGIPEQRTLEMMVEQINEDGGIKGHPLEVIIYDAKSTVDDCVSAVVALIEQDNVLAIIGPSSSGESTGIIETVTAAKIPNVSLAARLSIVTPVEERYWVFKTPQTEVEAVRAIYAYLQGKGITQIAIITDTSGYGQGGKQYLESDAGDYGITILDEQTFSSGDTDMTSQLTHIKGTADVQAVICWATDKESAVVAQNMKTLQMTVPLFCSHGVANKAFINAGGASVEGVIIPAGKLLAADEIPASDPQQEVLVKYKNDYEAIYGAGSIDTFGGHAYDALSMIVAALENMSEGLTTTEARAFIRDYIENDITDFALTGGVFTMSPTNHLGMSPGSLLMYEIKDGDWSWLK